MKFELLSRYPYIKHIVTQKEMGYSCGFSLALHTGEDINSIISNRGIVEEYFGEDNIYCSLRQVHSSMVHICNETESKGWKDIENAVEADAVITDRRGVVLTILTADCVPILLFDPIKNIIGAVHAGWKGSADKILTKTIKAMEGEYGSNPKDLVVAIGPSIGKCCYEVDRDVAKHFEEYDTGALETGDRDGKYQLDLKVINSIQAQECGVDIDNIEISKICTSCDNEHFFSYRAENGCKGRFMSAICNI